MNTPFNFHLTKFSNEAEILRSEVREFLSDHSRIYLKKLQQKRGTAPMKISVRRLVRWVG
jgi:hypothetical protein